MNKKVWSEIKDVVSTIGILERDIEQLNMELAEYQEKLDIKKQKLSKLYDEYQKLNLRLYADD